MQNKFTLNFTKEAREDLFEILEYITNNLSAPVAAGNLIDKIENACTRLTSFPLSGAIPRDDTLARKGYRILVVDKFIVFYLVDETSVKIIRVVYGKRNYQNLM